MNRKVRAIYFKELLESFRDRRTIFAMAVLPVVLYPLIIIGTSEVQQLAKAKLDRESFPIAVLPGTKSFVQQMLRVALDAPESIKGLAAPDKRSKVPTNAENPAPVKKSVKEMVEEQNANLPKEAIASPNTTKPGVKPTPDDPTHDSEDEPVDALHSTKFDFQEMSAVDAERALADGKVRAILSVPADFEKALDGGARPEIGLKYDKAERVSQSAHSRLINMMERYENALILENLKRQSLTPRFLDPFVVDDQNIAKAEKVGGSIFGSILPMLFIMMLMTGALHPAVDMTAGEKERSTLETLVGAPAHPLEIIAGKFLAVSTLSLMNAALNLASFALTVKAIPGAANIGFSFPWSALPLTLLLLVPLALFFSALLLMVASFAANSKEAQIFCMPVFLGPMAMMAITMTPGIELEGPLLLTPVVNTCLLVKEIFLGHGTVQQICFVFFSTCLYAAGMVALAARAFAREEVLFSAQGSLRLFLSRRFFKAAPTPKAGDALLAAALLFPLNFYVQSYLQKILMGNSTKVTTATVVVSLLAAMYGLFLATPLLLAKYLKTDLKSTFIWNTPSPRAMFGAFLIGSSAWLVAIQLVSWQSMFWEPPQMKEMEHLFDSFNDSFLGQAALVFLIAVTPAICEEHFFRGFLQQGLLGSGVNRARNKWTAILLTGVIFGFFHIPVFRQPVVALFGVLIAWGAYETRSLWPGVLIHFLFNGLSTFGPKILKLKESDGLPVVYPAVALVVCVAGIWVMRGAEGKLSVPEGLKTLAGD